MFNKLLLDLFKNLNYEYIISELKKLRKGAAMILFIMCICCAIFDFFLRKHAIKVDLFTSVYLILGLCTIAIWAVKMFNQIANANYIKQIHKKNYKVLKPILMTLNTQEEYILRKFVRDDCPKIVLLENDLKAIDNNLNVINTIYNKFNSFKFFIIQCASNPHYILRIQEPFFEVLKLHFKK